MAHSPDLSVVIPVYNEQKNFEAGVLDAALSYLAKQTYSWEIIFVDDGSKDQSNRLLRGFCKKYTKCRILEIEHGGKAAAVTAGMLAVHGNVVIFTDFDQSTPLYNIEHFLQAHAEGADVVIGVRGKGSTTKSDTLIRKIRSWGFVTLVQLVALPGILDSQCGFKSFTRAAAHRIFSNLQVSGPLTNINGGYMGAFDVEVLFLARKYGYTVAQQAVDWVKVESEKLNIWKEPLMMVRDTFKVRVYDILGRYDQV